MIKRSLVLLASWVLVACVSPQAQPARDAIVGFNDWLAFVASANDLTPDELDVERADASSQYRHQPSDDIRLRLAYLVSRPPSAEQDLEQGRAILAEIDPGSPNAPLRDLVAHELALLAELNAARQRVNELQAQLDALKAIETDLTENQRIIEDRSQ
jgi:hypothetical protein